MPPEPRPLICRRHWAVGIVLAGLIPALPAATISGTVVVREGSRNTAVARAEVIARESGSSEVAAVARTDRDGRFLITGLGTPKVVLSVRKPRYFTASINGREDESITLDCPGPADCGDVRFELGLGGVVSGMVRDEFGEPAGMVFVRASPPHDAQPERGRSPRATSVRGEADDRGYFRLYGLKPGPYILEAEQRGGPMSGGFRGEPVAIEIEEGGELNGVLITGRISETPRRLTVSGKVTGVRWSADDIGMVMVQSIGSGSRWGGLVWSSSVRPDGSFDFQNLPPSRYAFRYAPRSERRGIDRGDATPLGVREIESDVSGLLLTPLPPTGFSGILEFESGGGPEQARIDVSSREGLGSFTAVAKSPDYRLEMTNLIPGTYNLSIDSTSGGGRGRGRGRGGPEYFLRGVRRGSELAPARDLVFTEGKIDQFELVISNEFSRVSGRVKAAREDETAGPIRKGAQFQVGLSGPSGFRAVQADQNGRFEFDRVIPGDYEICAWSSADSQAIYDEKTWTAAGNAVRKFPVDPGSDVEIDLTAVP